jgi:hypothetical protein
LKEVVARFKTQLEKTRTHFNESEWLRYVRKVDAATLSRNELLVFTDFSATCDLRATKLENCSQDAQVVLAIFVVCHSPRLITVKQEDKTTLRIKSTIAMYGISLGTRCPKERKMTTYFITHV